MLPDSRGSQVHTAARTVTVTWTFSAERVVRKKGMEGKSLVLQGDSLEEGITFIYLKGRVSLAF